MTGPGEDIAKGASNGQVSKNFQSEDRRDHVVRVRVSSSLCTSCSEAHRPCRTSRLFVPFATAPELQATIMRRDEAEDGSDDDDEARKRGYRYE